MWEMYDLHKILLGRWMSGQYMWGAVRNDEYRLATIEGFSRKNRRQETTWESDA